MSITKSVVKSPASAKFFSWLNIFLEKLVMYKCGSKSIYSATFYYFLLHSKGNILRFYFIFTVLTGKAQSFTIVFSLLGLLLCKRFFLGFTFINQQNWCFWFQKFTSMTDSTHFRMLVWQMLSVYVEGLQVSKFWP